MDLRHRFSVPTGIDAAWAHFQDIAGVAECFPGGTVDQVDGDTFSGQVKVKLGPIALVYHGSGSFVEKDEIAHRFVVDAQGRDKRGNGTAGAKVTLTMTEEGAASTGIEVLTDLAVTGKPAQFGRGVMQDVSDKLLGQFVQCLERRMASGETAPAAAATASTSSGSASQESSPEEEAPAPSAGSTGLLAAAAAPSVSASSKAPPVTSGPAEPEPAPAPSATESGPLLASTAAPSVQAAAQAPPVEPASPGSSAAADESSGSDDAIDLGATVLPVIIKSYGKQIALGVGGLLVLRWFRKILRGR